MNLILMNKKNILSRKKEFKNDIYFVAVNFLSKQANGILQLSYNDQVSISDLSLQSELSPIIVFQRTDKEAWKSVSSEVDCLIFT